MSVAARDALDRSARWSRLLELLATSGRLSVSDAAVQVGASEATVRRDFTALAEQQLVKRTHGGVVASSVAYDLPAQYRSPPGPDVKGAIAAAAADLIPIDSVVGFNGGTTTTATARHMASRPDLASSAKRTTITVVTNALNIAAELVLRPHVHTITLGGVARPRSYELVGPLAEAGLDRLWLDTLILGVRGLDTEHGAFCSHDGEAAVNALMVRRSSRVVVVAGSEKLGARALAQICTCDQIDVVVTDRGADARDLRALEAADIEVRLV